MTTGTVLPAKITPKRKKLLVMKGFQLRYVMLVAGSLIVLLLFAGFHGEFVTQTTLSPEILNKFLPVLRESTWRLFTVGILYIAVVTMSAIFLSHRTIGPIHRLEDEINKMIDSHDESHTLKIREGDEIEGLIVAINRLIGHLKKH